MGHFFFVYSVENRSKCFHLFLHVANKWNFKERRTCFNILWENEAIINNFDWTLGNHCELFEKKILLSSSTAIQLVSWFSFLPGKYCLPVVPYWTIHLVWGKEKIEFDHFLALDNEAKKWVRKWTALISRSFRGFVFVITAKLIFNFAEESIFLFSLFFFYTMTKHNIQSNYFFSCRKKNRIFFIYNSMPVLKYDN